MAIGTTSRDIQSIVERPTDGVADTLISSDNMDALKRRLDDADFHTVIEEKPFDILRVEIPERAVKSVRSWPEVKGIQVNHEFHFYQGN